MVFLLKESLGHVHNALHHHHRYRRIVSIVSTSTNLQGLQNKKKRERSFTKAEDGDCTIVIKAKTEMIYILNNQNLTMLKHVI